MCNTGAKLTRFQGQAVLEKVSSFGRPCNCDTPHSVAVG